jgi:hypothetical protein
MRQVITGVSIFVGLQIVYVAVLLGMTLWEGHQLDRGKRQAAPTPQPVPASPADREAAASPSSMPGPTGTGDLPLSA